MSKNDFPKIVLEKIVRETIKKVMQRRFSKHLLFCDANFFMIFEHFRIFKNVLATLKHF